MRFSPSALAAAARNCSALIAWTCADTAGAGAAAMGAAVGVVVVASVPACSSLEQAASATTSDSAIQRDFFEIVTTDIRLLPRQAAIGKNPIPAKHEAC